VKIFVFQTTVIKKTKINTIQYNTKMISIAPW